MAFGLGLRPAAVDLEILRLRAQRLVTVEELSGKTWVALTGEAFRSMGSSPRTRAHDRERAQASRPRQADPDDPAFR
ncbi:MAG: hypothetical protein ACYDDF_03000 [Thermoplasmatota archaeon]